MKKSFNKKSTMKIGALLPLTGEDRQYGHWIKEGLELGREEINAHDGINGKDLEIIYEDDAANPKKAVIGMKKLCEKMKVPVVFGSWASSCVTAQIPIARRTKTVVLAEAISPKISKTGGYVYVIQPNATYYLKKLAPFTFFDLKVRKVGILHVQNDFGVGQKDTFKEIFENLGGKIIHIEKFSQGQSNFQKELSNIKKDNPEALFVPAYTEIIHILKQARKMALKMKFLTSPPFENPEILTAVGKAAEGVIYPYHYAPDPENIVDLGLRKKYKKVYGREPEGFAALAYDGIHIIAKALRNCGEDRECLKKAFYRMHHYGVTGEIVFDETGNPIKKIIIKTVKKGRFVSYKLRTQQMAFFTVGPYEIRE